MFRLEYERVGNSDAYRFTTELIDADWFACEDGLVKFYQDDEVRVVYAVPLPRVVSIKQMAEATDAVEAEPAGIS